MEYDVTIGIPVYKSADYIRRALESALAQTYSSIEYLVIDDAGYDGSLDIINAIAQAHPRGKDIRVICHQENLGVSASRNQIIDEAQGEYLYFMDSDDTIAVNAIELLMQNIRQYDAEIVFGSYEKIELSGIKTSYQYPSIQLLQEGELASFAYRKYAGIQASACNFLVKLSVLHDNHHRFINASFWEDMVFTFDLVTMISRAVLLPDITYTYICHQNSLSRYQKRDVISKNEVCKNIKTIDYLKQTSSVLSNKAYYPNRCYNIVLADFYIACHILKKKDAIVPSISYEEIRQLMKHPATFRTIFLFRQSRLKNMMMYLISILPSTLCVVVIYCLGKIKKLI